MVGRLHTVAAGVVQVPVRVRTFGTRFARKCYELAVGGAHFLHCDLIAGCSGTLA